MAHRDPASSHPQDPAATESHVQPNAHPESDVKRGEHSTIPHPPPEDHPKNDPVVHKPIPDTGWRGQPSLPSQQGGTGETDFMNKPPYWWKSEGDKFKVKYVS